MINTVIFDIGMVLVYYDWRAYLVDLFKDEKKVDILYDAFFCHGIWDELDRAALNKEELVEAFTECAGGYREEISYFIDRIGNAIEQYDHAKPWIKSLKEQGFKVYYLSNYNDFVIEQNRECLDFIPMVDGGLFSYEVKSVKPEKRIFDELSRKYDINPAEAVFIDDNINNVEAARSYGYNAVQFISANQVKKELDGLIGCVL